ncbi:cyclodehydratase [Couchioplanes azureus]|uniref:cyclodehydratase n=1 Tax=Couchioplanes caeruleus TaxID=56438 RepID=UPI00166F749D|nr:cyclodehydratase [Couchioplanes caeruleus]GGQ48547.1 cyclase [Couchioplanes caeruleus subsp. azureus]
MRRLVRTAGLLCATGGLLLAGLLGAVPAAHAAATVPVTLDCQGRPPLGPPQQLTLSTSIQADAPATVGAGTDFEVALAPDPMTAPPTAGGFTVDNLRTLVLRVAVSPGATVRSATLSGGSNLGSGTPAVSHAGNLVTATVPGPIAGGSTFQLPALHLRLTATGAAGTAVVTTLAGTGYADPSLTFTAGVRAGPLTLNVPTACYPTPSPTFTSTTIA